MHRVVLAILLLGLLTPAGGEALPRRGRGPLHADVTNSFTFAWTNSTMTCGQFRLGSFTGAKLWYDDNDACPGPIAAQAKLTESGTGVFAFQLNLTDDTAPNTASQVTLSATDGSGAWIRLHLNVVIDGQPYIPGSAVYPGSGWVANIRITPTVFSSSSAGCYNYGTSSDPPNQTNCGHAIVASTPGAAANTSGQHQGNYQGSATVIAYL
jgi:hypothetical protein